MTEIFIIGAFLLFIIYREHQHAREVELLSKAVIAKNIYELKEAEVKDSSNNDKEKVSLIPTDQVSDLEFLKAIQKDLGRETPQEKFKEKVVDKIWPKSNK